MLLKIENNIDLMLVYVKVGSLQLDVGKDLIFDMVMKMNMCVSWDGVISVVIMFGLIVKLDVVGNVLIVIGGNFQQNVGNLLVGGNFGMNVGGNWDFGVVQMGEYKIVQWVNGVLNIDINKVIGSLVMVGGQLNVVVGGDLMVKGVQIDFGQGGIFVVKGNVMFGVVSVILMVNSNSLGSDSYGSYVEMLYMLDQVFIGMMFRGGDIVILVLGKDFMISGSMVSLDKGNVNLLVVGDVNVGVVIEMYVLNLYEMYSYSNVVSGVKVVSGIDQIVIYSQGSMILVDGVIVMSGWDINVMGSNIVGINDVLLFVVWDVNIKILQDMI